MPDTVLEIVDLHKTFRGRRGRRLALDGLDMTVEHGGVHGFLGPNGSGKTTTIRIMLGLVRPDSGTVRVLNLPVPKYQHAVAVSIGAVVEAPTFFPNFSGGRNLRLLAKTAGISDARVDEVLEQVGLAGRTGDRYRTYSLGMKQRLAVAAALLKKPRLLVLDEPMNGLDPAGIKEMRTLMQNVSNDGTTVLLSSHILGEVEQVCDSVTILSRGRHIVSGSVRDVLAGREHSEVVVRIADLEAAIAVLERNGVTVRREADQLRVSGAPEPADITKWLAIEGHFVSQLTPVEASLESVFLEMTGPPGDGMAASLDAAVPEEAA